jgi:transcriptional regulator with XRE-family HTH domain
MKRTYTPTEADALTGRQIRALRNRRGETLKQTVEASGFGKDASTLAATERGERLLTDLEATKLAAHFDTTVDKIRRPKYLGEYGAVATEQEWLGNREVTPIATTTPLFAVPDPVKQISDVPVAGFGRTLVIDLDNPPTPDEYRAQVWIPYLEARYTAETA